MLVPVSHLQANTTYVVWESHEGSESFTVVVKRKFKPVQEGEFDLAKFRQAYASRNGLRKLDYSEPSKFTLNG